MSLPRNLIVLSAVTVLAVIATFAVVLRQGEETSPTLEIQAMFPKLKDSLNEVTRLEVITKSGRFTVTRDRDRWLLPDKDGYAADSGLVRRTLIELSELQLVERKTAQADRHKAIGLDSPEAGGEGILVRVYGKEELPIAGAIISSFSPSGGTDRFYVRWPAEDQTWIAEGALDLKEEPAQWLNTEILGINRGDIKSAHVIPFEGPDYVLSRASPELSDFTLENVPAGRKAKPAYSWNTTAFAPSSLTISDVRATKPDWAPELGAVTYELFDGTQLTLGLSRSEDENYWVTLMDIQPGDSDAAGTGEQTEPGAAVADAGAAVRRAEEIERQMSGWDFGIPSFKYEQFAKPLEELLEPVNEGAAAPDAP